MSQKRIDIILPSGRPAKIETPEREKDPVSVNDLEYLGRWGEYGLFESNDLKMVVIKLKVTSIVKGIGPALLQGMFWTTKLTPLKAVELGMAEFETTLPENGYVIPDRNVHKWVEVLPEPEAKTQTDTEEVNGDDLM